MHRMYLKKILGNKKIGNPSGYIVHKYLYKQIIYLFHEMCENIHVSISVGLSINIYNQNNAVINDIISKVMYNNTNFFIVVELFVFP